MKLAVLYVSGNEKPHCDLVGPCGGADKAIFQHIRNMAVAGHRIWYYSLYSGRTAWQHDNVVYGHVNDYYKSKNEFDALIVYRRAAPVNVGERVSIFYTQDASNSPAAKTLSGMEKYYDAFIVLSEWHKADLQAIFALEGKKIYILGNGHDFIKMPRVRNNAPFKLLYASTPYRGLNMAHAVMNRLSKTSAPFKLTVYSSMSIYPSHKQYDTMFLSLYDSLKSLDNVNYKAAVGMDELIDAYQDADILFYPNSFAETYCNVVHESIAAGTPVLTSNLGNLPSLVGRCGVCVNVKGLNPKQTVDAYENALKEMVQDYGKYFRAAQNRLMPKWNKRTQELLQIIKKTLEGKRNG